MHNSQERYLMARRDGYIQAAAARLAGVGLSSIKRWMASDFDFRAACEDADVEAGAWYASRMRDKAANGDTGAIKLGLQVFGLLSEAPIVNVSTTAVDLSGLTTDELRRLSMQMFDGVGRHLSGDVVDSAALVGLETPTPENEHPPTPRGQGGLGARNEGGSQDTWEYGLESSDYGERFT